jgi:asparagine synthase (glutamine-hydrolysing)
MCGVIGWIAGRPLKGGDAFLQSGMDALAHRGPDGCGHWRAVLSGGGEAALGHTRLAIIDAEGGAQPFFSHDRRFVVSFNGEIYNYIELREQLRAKGCRFATESDTEVLLEAWRAWGEDGLIRLRGMFAFALYDLQTERLVLARDPFGKKPLFMAEVAEGIAFASEIAPLLLLPEVEGGLNREVLGDYLTRRYAPGPATFFKGVRKLRPGHLAIYEGGGAVERRYFAPPLAETTAGAIGFPEAVHVFRAALSEAVRLRLRSDAPYGVYLSGGLDSSVIAAIMARQVGDLQSFSVGFEEAAFSETPYAERVATRLGARHRALTVTAQDFAAHWLLAVRHRGAPVSEASDIPILILSEAASASVKMVLTGEGADELLAGYPKHRAERLIGGYHAVVPPNLHRRYADPFVQRFPYGSRRLKILSRALGEPDAQARSRQWFASGDVDMVTDLLGQPTRHEPPRPSKRSSLRELMLADQTGWLPDNLLERGDRMLMAAGIEGRAPFMDVELSALTATFPDRLLFDRRGGKAILRAAVGDLLDAETLNRRKVGFRTPVGEWFRGELRALLLDLLSGEGSGVRRLLNGAVIDRLLAQHLSRRVDQTDMLWTLANLELFLRAFRLSDEV